MEPINTKRKRKRGPGFQPGAWFASRRWDKALTAAPAVVVATAIGATCGWTLTRTEALQQRYLQSLSRAVEEDQTEVAERYANKLTTLGVAERPEVQWIRTVIDLRQGRLETAQAMLAKLAPHDAVGYPQAHLFIAQQLARQNGPDKQAATLLKHHLMAASSISAQQEWTAETLAKIYLAENDLKSATDQLETIAPEKPETWLVIAKIKQQQGDEAGQREAFQAATAALTKQITDQPDDTARRLLLAQATLKSEGFRATEAILLAGLKRNSEAAELRDALATLYVQHSDKIRSTAVSGSGEIVDAFQLIKRAIKLAPNHSQALQRLVSFLDEPGLAEEHAQQMVSDLLASGKATANVHLLLATRAMMAGDDATAQIHMDQGFEKDPNLPTLLNNMAWLVARQDPPDLETALGYANKAIGLVGNNREIAMRVRDTRGHILVKMERWQAAIDDLETALPQLSDRAKINTHKALTKAYRVLGQNDAATAHQRQAEAVGLEAKPAD
ncbi:Tetratricopeptide repeat protein [Rosistilla ulvae]|uniref:Tetratricopeptide repeat protein n=1 Tax=Rosistilla ulvae TaxID=1930277 RepID=A0A517LVB6_9BACT|nr:hypothetical protein [Rosistilla ulvae]QDS86560.1 Tetratricopeptide repeat protein [Rosistilla ulvae]